MRALFWVLRVLTCGSGLLTLLLPESMAVVPGVMFSVLFLAQLAIWGLSSPQIRPFLAAMAAASHRLSVCGGAGGHVAQEPFESEKLRELAAVLGGAREPLRRLAGLSRRIGLGNSSILAFILNGLFCGISGMPLRSTAGSRSGEKNPRIGSLRWARRKAC